MLQVEGEEWWKEGEVKEEHIVSQFSLTNLFLWIHFQFYTSDAHSAHFMMTVRRNSFSAKSLEGIGNPKIFAFPPKLKRKNSLGRRIWCALQRLKFKYIDVTLFKFMCTFLDNKSLYIAYQCSSSVKRKRDNSRKVYPTFGCDYRAWLPNVACRCDFRIWFRLWLLDVVSEYSFWICFPSVTFRIWLHSVPYFQITVWTYSSEIIFSANKGNFFSYSHANCTPLQEIRV